MDPVTEGLDGSPDDGYQLACADHREITAQGAKSAAPEFSQQPATLFSVSGAGRLAREEGC